MTPRVCRSVLAVDVRRLADGVEAVAGTAVVLQEISKGTVDVKKWQDVAAAIPHFWATGCESGHDYLTKEGTSMSEDKRMAIEGALLKETLRSPFTTLRRTDGSQNLADVLTKLATCTGCLGQPRGRLRRTRLRQRTRSASRRRGVFAKRTRALPRKTRSVKTEGGEPLKCQSCLLPAGPHFKSLGM